MTRSQSARTSQAFSSTEASIVNPLHTNLRTALAGVCQASQTQQPSQLLPSVATTPLAGNWIAAVSSLGGEATASILECYPNSIRMLAGLLPRSRDMISGICNFCRTQPYTSGKCFSFCSFALCSLIKLCQEPASSVFHRFQFSPVRPSAVAHERNHRRRSGQGVVR